MMKPSLQLRIGQQLTMTPQLQQAIRLLQLPALELQAQIREALESNVMLEAEDEQEEVSLEGLEAAPAGEAGETAETDSTEPTVEIGDDWPEPTATESDAPWSGGDDDRMLDLADESGQTLTDHLLWQLELAHLTPAQLMIGRAIIDALNDDGYLTESAADIARSLSADLPVSEDDVEQVLAFVQTLDPTGVGARTASECICLQLEQLDPDTPGRDLALRIAHDHLQVVADRDLASLRRSFDADEDALLAALALILLLPPLQPIDQLGHLRVADVLALQAHAEFLARRPVEARQAECAYERSSPLRPYRQQYLSPGKLQRPRGAEGLAGPGGGLPVRPGSRYR